MDPWKNQPYPAPKAPAGGTIAGIVVDGIGGLAWKPCSAFFSIVHAGQNQEVTSAAPNPPVNPPSNVVILQVLGLLGNGGQYERRFILPVYRTVCMDVSAFQDIRVNVLYADLLQSDTLYVNVTNKPMDVHQWEPVTYQETYAAPGRYLVPPGADRLFSAGLDAGFSWSGRSAAAPVAIPDPLLAGDERDVRAAAFTTTVGNLSLSWRLWL